MKKSLLLLVALVLILTACGGDCEITGTHATQDKDGTVHLFFDLQCTDEDITKEVAPAVFFDHKIGDTFNP